MSKLQPIQFRDVDDLLASLPKSELAVTLALRDIIFSCIPHAIEKLSYNVPYYSVNKRICFIWPGSVPWGTIKEGVLLGFTKGYLLNDELNFLEKGNRKEVYVRTFMNLSDINYEYLKLLLFEAVEIDLKSKK